MAIRIYVLPYLLGKITPFDNLIDWIALNY